MPGYTFPRGWTTFVRETLSKDVIMSAALSAQGDGELHVELSDEIEALPFYHRVFPNGSSFRAKTQKFGLVVKELAGDGFAGKMKDYDSNQASIQFIALPRTIDRATGIERPYTQLALASFSLQGSAAGSISLVLNHTVYFDGPMGTLDDGSMNDYDPVADEDFTAQLHGLVTSIAFGWRYQGGADSGSSSSSGGPPIGVTLGMGVAFQDVDVIVVPGDAF